jgi:hypothetical protein
MSSPPHSNAMSSESIEVSPSELGWGGSGVCALRAAAERVLRSGVERVAMPVRGRVAGRAGWRVGVDATRTPPRLFGGGGTPLTASGLGTSGRVGWARRGLDRSGRSLASCVTDRGADFVALRGCAPPFEYGSEVDDATGLLLVRSASGRDVDRPPLCSGVRLVLPVLGQAVLARDNGVGSAGLDCADWSRNLSSSSSSFVLSVGAGDGSDAAPRIKRRGRFSAGLSAPNDDEPMGRARCVGAGRGRGSSATLSRKAFRSSSSSCHPTPLPRSSLSRCSRLRRARVFGVSIVSSSSRLKGMGWAASSGELGCVGVWGGGDADAAA